MALRLREGATGGLEELVFAGPDESLAEERVTLGDMRINDLKKW